METVPSNSTSRWVGAYAELVSATRGRPDGLNRVFQRSLVPMVIVNDERRYVDVNPAARLAFRLSLSELQQLRIDDLTPRSRWPLMHDAWARLVTSGCVAGFYEVASPPNTSMDIAYYAVADALPGLYLIAFAPAGWHESELAGDPGLVPGPEVAALTERELEVLELAADGRSAPMIAAELIVSITTVPMCISFQYVIDGCYARAHAMRRIIEGQYGYCCEKVFSFANQNMDVLAVNASKWGGCLRDLVVSRRPVRPRQGHHQARSVPTTVRARARHRSGHIRQAGPPQLMG